MKEETECRAELSELPLFDRREELPLFEVLAPVGVGDAALARSREPYRHEATVLRLAMPLDEPVALERVQQARHGCARQAGQSCDVARLELAGHPHAEHDAESAHRPPRGMVDGRLQVLHEPRRETDQVEARPERVGVDVATDGVADPLIGLLLELRCVQAAHATTPRRPWRRSLIVPSIVPFVSRSC